METPVKKRSTPNKLTDADLEEMRILYEDPDRIAVTKIGHLFGVSKVAVYKRASVLGWQQRTDERARERGESILVTVLAKRQPIGIDGNLNGNSFGNVGTDVDASRPTFRGTEKTILQQDSSFGSHDGSKSGHSTFTRDREKPASLPPGVKGGNKRPVDRLPAAQVALAMTGLGYRPPAVSAAFGTANGADGNITPLDEERHRASVVIASVRVLMTAGQLSMLERHQGLVSRFQVAFEHFFDPLSVVEAMPDANNLRDQERVELARKIRSDAQQVIAPTEKDTVAKTWKEMTDSIVKVFAMQRQALGLNTSNSSPDTNSFSLNKAPDTSRIIEQTSVEDLATIQRFIALTDAVRSRDRPKPPPPR